MGMTTMAKRSISKAKADAIETADPREIPQAWVSASLIPGEASTSRSNQNTGRDYELVTRGITGTAYRAATINATVLSGQTLRLYRKVGTGVAKAGRKVADRRQVRHATNRGGVKSLVGKAAMYASRAGDEVEEVLDHPVLDLLQNPDPVYTGSLWMHMLCWFKEVAGRAYFYVGERLNGYPISAYILPSQFAWPMLSETGLIDGYYYGRNRSAPMRIASEDVVYLRQHGSPVHPAGGMSWLFSVMAETDMEAAALQAEAQRWLNGGMPGMVFKAAPTTTDAQMKQINAHLNQSARGVGKAGSILLLRDTELVQYDTKPHEMQYVEGITTTEKRIYDAAGIPEPIYRLNSANLASATVANAQYMRYTIAPRLATLAGELTELLLPHFGVEPGEMWFCFDDPTQDDQIQLAAELRVGEAQGLVRPNEYRHVMDLEALPDDQNLLRYRQTEAPAPVGGILGGMGLPAPAKASEMPEGDAGAQSVDVETPSVNATMDASTDMEPGEMPGDMPEGPMEPSSPSADVSVDVQTQDVPAAKAAAKAIATKAESFEPTDAMATEAQRGLDWRAEYGRGGTEVGVARARDIVNKRNLSLDTVYRMASYFARHEVDKQGQGWSRGEDGYPSAGRIAWALWGGDPGKSWANGIIAEVEREDESGDKAMHARAACADGCGCPRHAQLSHDRDRVGGDVATRAKAGADTGGDGDVLPSAVPPAVDGPAVDAQLTGKLCDTKPCDTRPRLKVPKRCKAFVTVWDEATGVPAVSSRAYNGFIADLQAWYAGVVPSMVNDQGMVISMTAGDMKELDAIADRFLRQVLEAGALDGFGKIGATDATFNVGNETAMSYVRNRGLALVTSVGETLKPQLQAAIERQLAAGATIADLRDAIKETAPDLTEWQAVRIARTETAAAYNEGNRQAWEQMGVTTKEWDIAGGPCPMCQGIADAYPGEVPMSTVYTGGDWSGQAPPAHPNCRCGLLPGVEYTDEE